MVDMRNVKWPSPIDWDQKAILWKVVEIADRLQFSKKIGRVIGAGVHALSEIILGASAAASVETRKKELTVDFQATAFLPKGANCTNHRSSSFPGSPSDSALATASSLMGIIFILQVSNSSGSLITCPRQAPPASPSNFAASSASSLLS